MENFDQEQKNEPKESNQELITILKEFLKDTNLEKIITSLNIGQSQKLDNQKDVGAKHLTFWKYKFIKEFATVVVIVIAVVLLAIFTDLENSTIGTLLGSIIGYSIGNFSSSNRKN